MRAQVPRPVGPRVAEAICGVVAAILGGAGLWVALFSDTMVSVSSRVVTSVALCATPPCPRASVPAIPSQTVTHSSIAGTQGIGGTLEVLVIGVIVVLALIALAAVMHAISSRVPWLALLGLATGLLMLGTVLTGFSIGLFFLPADALSVLAAGLGLSQMVGPPQPVTFPGR